MLRITIRDLKPNAVYEGTVYTQWVVCDSTDGTRLYVEDSTCAFGEADIGTVVTVEVRGQSVQAVQDNPDERFEIASTNSRAVDIYGRVDAVNTADEYPLPIAVQTGVVQVEVTGQESVEPGDWVTVPGVTLFLDSVVSDSQ